MDDYSSVVKDGSFETARNVDTLFKNILYHKWSVSRISIRTMTHSRSLTTDSILAYYINNIFAMSTISINYS